MFWHRTAALLACLCLAPPVSPAWATGGFSCEVNDKSLTLEVSAALSRGMGSVILSPSGRLALKSEKLPADMRNFDLAQAMVHHWMAHPSLMLHYYVERQSDKPFASVELIIDTKASGDDETTKGSYLVNIYSVDPTTSEGKTQELKGRVPASWNDQHRFSGPKEDGNNSSSVKVRMSLPCSVQQWILMSPLANSLIF